MPISVVCRSVKDFSCLRESNNVGNWWGKLIEKYAERKTLQILKRINPYIKKSGKVLDVGLGLGSIACSLLRRGYKVEGVDVSDSSLYFDLKPKIYDGLHLPYKDKSFDTALIIAVLHHCGENNLNVFREAKRVAKRVIVIEDTYRNFFEKIFVSINDMISNLEFYNHNYLTLEQWRSFIKNEKWKLVHDEQWSNNNYIYTRYCMLVVE